MKRLYDMDFQHDVWYIARTNEEGPPIKCQWLRNEEHPKSGSLIPYFAEEVAPDYWREFMFMGPVVEFDQDLFDKLKSMPGRAGYNWLVNQLED